MSMSAQPTALARTAILVIAPAVQVFGHSYHPWIGNPGDAGFLARLAAAVAANPTRWAVAHLLVGIGSGLLALAFLGIRSYLREAGEERWTAWGLPFIVLGSTLFAMLPAMEFAPLAAARAGGDVAATQAALLAWFTPLLLASAIVFGLGALAFAAGVARSGVLSPTLTWVVIVALVVMAGARFLPVGAAQLYVGPVAGLVALWPLAYVMWKQPHARHAGIVPAT
jgi:hypothetical protein